jgi:hypothetical protein
MGQNLANLLNGHIDDMVTDDTPRSDIVAEMASAAGIEPGTVNEILTNDIPCPPLIRLEGFSEVLPASLSAITEAAEEDGCSYEEERKRSMFAKFTGWLKRELGLVQRRIKDVEEWSGAASNYSSTEEYCNACLINVNESDDPEDWTQANCKLPVREEGDSSDTFVRQAVFAASGGRGITQVEKPADVSQDAWDRAVQEAANQLLGAYDEMDQDAPESVVEIAERSKERALSTSQLWSIVYEQLEEIYGWDYWPMDIYYDAAGMPFVVVAVNGKLFRHSIMLDEDLTTIGEAIPVVQEFIPTARTTTTIRRAANGQWRWFSVSASSVLNRVGEIDSRDLFDSFVAHAEETGEYPIRQFYHAGEAFRTGEADFLARDDNLYITSGLYDETEIAEREVKARQKEPEYWGDSIGYLPTDKPELLEVAESVTIPVYKRGINKEISTLPEEDAANLFTANTEMLEVRRAMKGKQKEAFVKLFDGNEEEADAWLDEHAEARNRAIEQDGLITRSDDDNEPEEQGQEIVHELSDEDAARILEQSKPIQQMAETIEEVGRAVADFGELKELDGIIRKYIEQLTGEIQGLAERLGTLEADDETKQREWLENQPRRFNGNVKHIIRPRVARANKNETEPETSSDVVAGTMTAKGIPNY